MLSLEKKTKKQSSEVTQNPSLPDDLLLTCFARISRLYYPTLSLVSKSFRSLIASPELYKTRSFTESCFYVCLEFPDEPNQRWFTLCRKPNQTLTNNKKKKSSGYVLAPVPVPNSPTVHCNGLVAVGSNIYAIGGSNRYSSSVSILDCRTHKWHEAPRMRIERNCASSNVVDGRIYVAGGFQDYNDSNWMEVFDTNTQTWKFVVSPLAKRCMSRIYKSAVIKGKIYLFGYNGVAYNPKEDKWIAIGENRNINAGWLWHSHCVVDNVLYSYHSRGILWYNHVVRNWMILKGLERLPKIACCSTVKLVACGGKLVVLWDKNVPASGYKEKMIWCAEISLEKRKSKEIWGKVEWFDAVLTVPKSYNFVAALAVMPYEVDLNVVKSFSDLSVLCPI